LAFTTDPLKIDDPQVIFLNNEISLDTWTINGHVIMWSKTTFDPMGNSIQTAMAVRTPHVSTRVHAIFEDFLGGRLGRRSDSALTTVLSRLSASRHLGSFLIVAIGPYTIKVSVR